MVPLAGLEPATYRLGGGHSVQLNYRGVMDAPLGFEPRLPGSKAGVLPLDEGAMN
jgi:hypothetical protein